MFLLSLVGEQPIPNLLPLFQDASIKTVRFAATAATRSVALGLERFICQDRTLSRLQVQPVLDLPAYQIDKAREEISHALVEQLKGGPVWVNLTGGTKIMSLAAMLAAKDYGAGLLYVSSEENQIILLNSNGAENGRQPLNVQVSVEQYLHAHDLEVSDTLNFSSLGPRSRVRQPKEGDQLEEIVYHQLRDSGRFDDVRRNVYIRKKVRGDWVVNELDVVVTLNGRMAVCSCKSGSVTKEHVYELSSLSRREAAGIYCGKVLICGLADIADAVKQRASGFGVRVIYGSTVQNCVDKVLSAVVPASVKESRS